ncbi:MAG: VWA domain-containing protein [Holophagales bacterium]|nr:VWA domain-containing protein [Holophagales bacterium]MYH26405.1 VWA domain-containing protein [Holophagales bacterium]
MRFGTVAAVTSCIAAVPVWGQETPLPELFSDTIDVRVVNVEVVVTDRRGNRVPGLEAKDFELLVDDEQMPIKYFTEIDDGRAKTLPEDRGGATPAVTPEGQVGTNYLIFIDEMSAIRQNRNRILRHIEEDLDALGPADRVALVAFDGRSLTRITDWTSSRDEIEAALSRARDRTALGLLNKFGLGFETRRSVMAAAGTVRSFADAPGRKVMLLLAAGWDTQVDLWNPRVLWVLGLSDAGLADLYGPLVHAANLVGYSLYPIDMGGAGPARPNDPRVNQKEFGLTGLAAPWGGRPDEPEDPQRWRDVLHYLADETGGLPMISFLGNRALAETAEDTRSYYWLGFEPPRAEDDTLHDIEVRVGGKPWLRVRSRQNYLDMSRGTEVTMLVEGALLFGGTPGAATLEIRFGAPEKAGFRKIAVPMEVRIPLEDLTVLPAGGQWMNEVEFRLTVIDEYGDHSDTPLSRIPILRAEAPMPGQTFVYETDLVMRKRPHRYVAAIHDPLSGAILSSSGSVGPEGSP